jgi:hypothetical protein
LINEWPELFDVTHPRPLAIGIHKVIRTASGISGAIVRKVPDELTRRPTYLEALVAGAARYALARRAVR